MQKLENSNADKTMNETSVPISGSTSSTPQNSSNGTITAPGVNSGRGKRGGGRGGLGRGGQGNRSQGNNRGGQNGGRFQRNGNHTGQNQGEKKWEENSHNSGPAKTSEVNLTTLNQLS